jgi:hypothetical protein
MESVCLNFGDDVVEGTVWVPKPDPEELATTEATPCKRNGRLASIWRVIEPIGIATRTPSTEGVRIVQPANRAVATTASYYQGEFAAHAPGCGGTATRLKRGSGKGNMETVMPTDDFKDFFVLKIAEMA